VLSKDSIKNNRKRQKPLIQDKIYIDDDDDNFFVVTSNFTITNHRSPKPH